MVITLDDELATALQKAAEQCDITPEAYALMVLRAKFLNDPPLQPRDQWERRLLELPIDCGVSIPNSALSRDELYD